VEFQAAYVAAANENAAKAQAAVKGLDLLGEPSSPPIRWSKKNFGISARECSFGGAVRKSGTTVIIEDVVFPLEHLADAAVDLIHLFEKHGYTNAIIFVMPRTATFTL